jgi:hypothetical protein
LEEHFKSIPTSQLQHSDITQCDFTLQISTTTLVLFIVKIPQQIIFSFWYCAKLVTLMESVAAVTTAAFLLSGFAGHAFKPPYQEI